MHVLNIGEIPKRRDESRRRRHECPRHGTGGLIRYEISDALH
jgi:hypothetical protein